MHDHVIGFIKEIPKKAMLFCKCKDTWTFTDSGGDIYNVKTEYSDVMPEWDNFDKQWYWVMIPK